MSNLLLPQGADPSKSAPVQERKSSLILRAGLEQIVSPYFFIIYLKVISRSESSGHDFIFHKQSVKALDQKICPH